ncbi:Fatty-acid synthase [Hyphodiscus hymeniophilus]|uniref:3-oxoacyl-[acyl-carrier-protein] synthase n=1 Tax=Hyphodiscus hymeniophilus TaxID=353542 RepID=A0A9P6VGN6_9HELO|nr:Fatty-acid synthase [Hyphodiscus hymeniophilus]
MRRVVVTGLGAITPLGVGIQRTWSRLLASECGIVSTSSLEPSTRWRELPSQVAGLVPLGSHEEGKWQASDWLKRGDERRMAKFTQYAIAATEMAFRDAGWRPQTQEEREMTGGYKKVSPLFVPQLLINLGAGHISMKYGLQGPNHAVTTACTTGAHSIGDASRFIAFGDADVMVAGGSESCIHPLAVAGFSRSRSLVTTYNTHPELSSRPFDRDRGGFVIAEGAGVVILEELEHAKARGAEIYAEIRGYGCSGDAHHITAPREDGHGALLAMKRALKNAGTRPKEVDYINAHATSTPLGDAAENAAIVTLMLGEEGVQKADEIAISSTKGAVGHLLGAAGAIEAIFSILAVKENTMPPTLNLHNKDSNFNCNYVPLESQRKDINVSMSNSFGFGGTNASLVFSKYR